MTQVQRMQTKDIAKPTFPNLKLIASALLAVLLFIFSIDLMTFSFGKLNSNVANEIFRATEDPFVGLFVGILMTALIQSSSAVSAMAVAVVASGSLSLTQAVPLIMGANIGTTLTSNLVSLSYITQKKAFKKALSAAVLHDFFNIITTLVLFPLEVYFGFLSNLAKNIAQFFVWDGSASAAEGFTPYRFFLRPISEAITGWLNWPLLWLVMAVALLFVSIKVLSNLAFESILSPKYKKASKHLFKQPYRAFGYGVFSTAAIQSSTITTSLIVTVVATGKASLNKVFPFIIGANIGTTITAGIAALYNTNAAISVALVHFLFNLIGALLFLPYPPLRRIPPQLASFFGEQIAKSRLIGLAYILLTFFVIPFLLIYFNND